MDLGQRQRRARQPVGDVTPLGDRRTSGTSAARARWRRGPRPRCASRRPRRPAARSPACPARTRISKPSRGVRGSRAAAAGSRPTRSRAAPRRGSRRWRSRRAPRPRAACWWRGARAPCARPPASCRSRRPSRAMKARPPSRTSTRTRCAPASSAFSTSSFTTEAGRSTTSPAAIWSTSVSGSRRTRAPGLPSRRSAGHRSPRRPPYHGLRRARQPQKIAEPRGRGVESPQFR